MSVMMLTAIDSSNIMDVKSTPRFRESLCTVMLMDLLVMGYAIVRDIGRFRLTSALITATFDTPAALPREALPARPQVVHAVRH